jgi:NAD(P)-dependent dehydrogenase (short-subunit alcohol dehydrogenase family)
MQCANSLTCKSQGKQRVAARATVRSRIPLGREGTPADVAGAVIYLTSELGAYLTGETIIINGGQSMYYIDVSIHMHVAHGDMLHACVN